MEKIEKNSFDLKKLNIEKIKELFPMCVTEGKINFDILRAILGDEVDTNKEKYQFTWPGKSDAIKIAQQNSGGTLRPDLETSKDWNTTENLYIEGDNLEVLKQLQKTYYKKIDAIYIDPPYNTGNDFIYKDNYQESLKSYKLQTQQMNSSNFESSGKYHTNWLNMMYPRLLIARNLLKDDGIIFVSINDCELENLSKIMTEIFGEFNLVSRIAVEMSKTQGMKVSAAQKGQIVKNHEYVLVFSKTENYCIDRIPLYDRAEVYDQHFDLIIQDDKVLPLIDYLLNDNYSCMIFKKYQLTINKSNLLQVLNASSEYRIYFNNEIAKKLYRKSMISLDDIQSMDITEGKITKHGKYLLIKNSKGTVEQLQCFYDTLKYSDEYNSEFERCTIRGALWKGFYSDMMNIAKEGNMEYKNGKKPVRLMKQLFKWINRPDGIYLDFFAGSCSTAQAVIELNSVDRGNRKYIMVQLPEILVKDKYYEKLGLKNLCDIGIERMNHVREKYINNKDYYNLDLGFKVFKLDSTNIKAWDNDKELDETTLFDYSEIFKEGRSKEDIVYEIMLKYGVFDMQMKEIEVNGKTMYRIGKRYMIVCLEDEVTKEDIEAIADLRVKNVVFKESGFENDNDKINAVHNLLKAGVEDIKCI